jgi:hypothetical protein
MRDMIDVVRADVFGQPDDVSTTVLNKINGLWDTESSLQKQRETERDRERDRE